MQGMGQKRTIIFLAAVLLLGACTFDYGTDDEDEDRPDIVMEHIEYARVRGGDLQVRFQAEYAERYEERLIMDLQRFSFEQMETGGESVSAEGSAGAAHIRLESGDVTFSGGVRINIESEDLIIETNGLEWRDQERIIFGGQEEEVDIHRSDGTSFTGIGFSADVRSRTWAFAGEVRGTFVDEEDDDDEDSQEDEMEEM